MGMIHTALWSSDLEATKEFYIGTLGFEPTVEFRWPEEDGVQNYYVGRNYGAELQFRYDPDRDEAITPAGIDHIAINVDNVDVEFERITDETNCPVVMEPTVVEPANARVAFVEDPDGYVVELVEDLD